VQVRILSGNRTAAVTVALERGIIRLEGSDSSSAGSLATQANSASHSGTCD
jgi:hypothetical protein